MSSSVRTSGSLATHKGTDLEKEDYTTISDALLKIVGKLGVDTRAYVELSNEIARLFLVHLAKVKRSIKEGRFHLDKPIQEEALESFVFGRIRYHLMAAPSERLNVGCSDLMKTMLEYLRLWKKAQIEAFFIEIFGGDLDVVPRHEGREEMARYQILAQDSTTPVDRVVVCSAVLYSTGLLLVGPRHFDSTMRAQAASVPNLYETPHVDGFIDQFGLFMDRCEALHIAKAMGQLKGTKCPPEDQLFSEDLY